MKHILNIIIIALMIQFILPMAISNPVFAQEAAAKEKKVATEKDDGLMQRIDFGNSYIMGQTIQSGAVYLLQRKKSEIKSMLEARENYREEILEGFNISNGELTSNGTHQR